jgi:DNA-binding NtrC family response regulator
MVSPSIEQTEQPAFRLVILSDSSVRTVPLVGDRWVVGRSEECDITLRDQTVSRRHFVLERHGEEFRFQDMGGVNPLLLDGRASRAGTIRPGHSLQVGMTRLSIDRRRQPMRVTAGHEHTQVISREVLDSEAAAAIQKRGPTDPAEVARLLESLEWPLAELGSLEDVSEPLLDLALNITGRRRGMLGMFDAGGTFRCLATMDHVDDSRELHVPDLLLQEVRSAKTPYLMSTHHRGEVMERLVLPLGGGQEMGMILLEEPRRDAPRGQDALRLARAIGGVAWQRLRETEQRLKLRDEVSRLRFLGSTAHGNILASTRLHGIRRHLRDAAGLDLPVLLVGEDGTEKQALAHYLHAHGPRANAPFLALFPALLPASAHEKEIFGNGLDGTGTLHRVGGGTLYIDAPEHLPEVIQARLVAAVRELRAQPGDSPRLVGGTVSDQVHAGPGSWTSVLTELFSGIRLVVPPLREDARDIVALAQLLLAEMGTGPEGTPRSLTERSKQLLMEYSWPGNVRELRLALEQAAANAGTGPISPRHFPESLQQRSTELPDLQSLETVERQHIAEILARVGGNRIRAAQVLGIATSTLYEKIKKYKLGNS